MHEYPSTISRIWMTFDEPGRLEAIESDRHPSAGEKKVLGKIRRSQGANELKLGECLEIPAMAQPVGGGDVIESRLNQMGGPKYSIAHFERREIKVRSGCLPASEHGVETIGHCCQYLHDPAQSN